MDRKEKRLRANTKLSTKDERPQLAGVLSQSSAVPRVATKTGVCRSPERPTPSEPLSSGFRCAGTRKPVTRSVRRRCRAPSSWLHRRGSPTWRKHADSLTDTRDSSRKHRARFSRDASSLPSSETLLATRRCNSRRLRSHTEQPTGTEQLSRREGSAPPQAPTPEARTSIFPLGRPPRRAHAHHNPLAGSTIRRAPDATCCARVPLSRPRASPSLLLPLRDTTRARARARADGAYA